jgi:hypothetical protein
MFPNLKSRSAWLGSSCAIDGMFFESLLSERSFVALGGSRSSLCHPR